MQQLPHDELFTAHLIVHFGGLFLWIQPRDYYADVGYLLFVLFFLQPLPKRCHLPQLFLIE